MTAKINPLLSKSEALSLAWKNRKDYIGYDKSKGSLFNTWRAIVYNRKGKNIGYPENWSSFVSFSSDVKCGWTKGKILIRKDTTKPYSKDNIEWAERGQENLGRLTQLEYNGKTQTLLEWARDLGVNYSGVRQRYFRGHNYSPEQILFGKIQATAQKKFHDIADLGYQESKNKLSKMISSYKNKDKKRGRYSDITIDFLEKAVRSKCVYCGDTKNIGLDRIDNSKGHTVDNCVPCCRICNTARNNIFSYSEMMILGKTIAAIKSSRKNDNI